MKTANWFKKTLSIMTVTSLLLTTAACSGSSNSEKPAASSGAGTASTSSVSAEPITLKFWDMVWGGTTYAEEAAKLAKSYSKVAPNVTIEYQSIPWQNRYETFSVAVASGEAPDISTGGGYQQHQFAAAGQILPLDSIIDEWKTEGKLDDFPAGMIDFFKMDGVQIGIPFNIDPRGIIYRKDMFEKKGIKIPTTYDELLQAAKALTDPATGTYGMVFPASDSAANICFFSWLAGNGGGVWKEDGKTPDWTNKQNLEALDFIAKMRDAKVFPAGMASYTEADAQKVFLQGKSAMIVGSVGFGVQVNANKDLTSNVALMPMPKGSSASEATMGSALNAYMVYKQTKHPEEAKAFVKWWSENNIALWTGAAKCGSPPARLSFLNDPSYVKMQDNPFLPQFVTNWVPEMKSTMYPAKSANLPQNTFDAERWWTKVCQAVLVGKKSNRAILDDMQKKAVDLIKDLGV